MKEVYFVKSFPSDFKLKTTDTTRTYTTQTIEWIFRKQKILPNTLSFWFEQKRLCTTILDEYYVDTYRPQGIIFQVVGKQKPDFIFPFDLNAITDNNTPVAEYYELVSEDQWAKLIKEYNHKLIDWFMEFVYDSYEELVHHLKSEDWFVHPDKVLEIVNAFRVSRWYEPLTADNKKLISYNEAVFLSPVEVKIVALYGDTKNPYYRQLSEKYGIPLYSSAKQFYETVNSS